MRGEFDRYQALLDALEPGIRDAFIEAIRQIKDRAIHRRVVAAIEAGDTEAVADMLDLTPEAMASVEDAIERVFRAGGEFQASVGPFYPRHERAIEWVRTAGAALVTEVARGQRAAIKGIITAGIDEGRGANSVARDIIGVTNRATGRREGGILGLTEREAGYVANARRQLQELDAGYFERQARDRRYDATVRKAIKAGKPLSADVIEKITRRYQDGLLTRRGNRIARTEAIGALNAGKYEQMRQQMDRLGLSSTDVTVKWVAARDPRVRDTHRALNGQTVDFGQPFQSPSGALMRFPGDRDFGAPASEVVSCRCQPVFEIRKRA